jgi:hypothetical protein
LTTFVSVLGVGITLLNNPLAIGEMVNPTLIASGATVTGKDVQYWDLKALQGTWKIQPISAQQVLIEHQVKVDPGSTPSLSLFYSIYENSLKQTLEAIKKETEHRN